MTFTLARRVQSWFTQGMTSSAPTKPRRETIEDKADRLVREGRFEMEPSSVVPSFWVGRVRGDHGTYAVFAISEQFMSDHGMDGGRVGCTCMAGRMGRLCSHALVAEEMRRR